VGGGGGEGGGGGRGWGGGGGGGGGGGARFSPSRFLGDLVRDFVFNLKAGGGGGGVVGRGWGGGVVQEWAQWLLEKSGFAARPAVRGAELLRRLVDHSCRLAARR